MKPDQIRWRAYEHKHEEKGADWYWALGIVALSASLTSVLFENVLFALVIVAAAVVLGMIAKQQPEIVEFLITEDGITTGDTFHPHETIRAFWIDETTDEPTLILDTERVMSPHLVIPITNEVDIIQLRMTLREYVNERPLSEPLSYKILELLGF